MNAYFQVLSNDEGTFLKYFPPTQGGLPVAPGEIAEYLNAHKIPSDAGALSAFIDTLREPGVTKVSPAKLDAPIDEEVKISVSDDRLTAYARFYAPSDAGSVMSADEIQRKLVASRISRGISEKIIRAFTAGRQYCRDIPIAKGIAPVQGKPATIKYFFNTQTHAKPTQREDGSVDFHNLNLVNNCKKGDVLAHLTKEVPGTAGVSVFGDVIKPAEVKKRSLTAVKNTCLSPDGLELCSSVDGHVQLIADKIFVSDVYRVENVDTSTGNIDYEGSVEVIGNVNSGFSVKAGGNVDVRGVVEAASVEAGGNIIIERGMNGMGKGTLMAGGDIIAKFIENASIECKGYVRSETIMHSQVLAGTEVTVDGKRGMISGGRICAKNCVSVKTLGSDMGSDTTIEIGADPIKKERLKELQRENEKLNADIEEIKQVLEVKFKSFQRQKSAELVKEIQSKQTQATAKAEVIRKNSEEIELLKAELAQGQRAYVAVTGVAYAGTRIVISDVSLTTKSAFKYCRFVKDQGEVKITAL